jgi:hypothetical protein
MPNVHTPERLKIESREQYAQRRLVSASIAYDMTHPPRQAAFKPGDGSKAPNKYHWWLGQRKRPERNRQRKACALIGFRQYKKIRRENRVLARNLDALAPVGA